MAQVPPHSRSRQTHRRQKRRSHAHAGYLAPLEYTEEYYAQIGNDDSDEMNGGAAAPPVYPEGGIPPVSVDGTPPAVPTGLALTSDVAQDADGHQVLRLIASLTQPVDADLFASYVEVTSDNDGNPDPNLQVPIWTNAAVLTIGAGQTAAVVEGVRGLTKYWARARAADFFGNFSVYTAEVSHTTTADVEAPGMPQSVAVVAGFQGFAMRWTPIAAADLMFNEVRYAPASGGGPDTAQWTYIRVKTNVIWIGELTAGTTYYAQVRSVDLSGNVVTNAVNETAVNYLQDSEAGWNDPRTWLPVTALENTDVFTRIAHGFVADDPVIFKGLVGGAGLAEETTYYVIAAGLTADEFKVSTSLGGGSVNITTDLTAGFVADVVPPILSLVPANIGAADIALHSLTSELISTSGLSADVIKTGLLKVNVADNGMVDGIEIWNAGIRVGYWNEAGLYIGTNAVGLPTTPPTNQNYIRITDAGLTVYLAGVAQAAITPDGINATAVNFGSLPGGHNLLLNSSFELADDSSVTVVAKTWDVTADFTGTDLGGGVNVANTDDIHMSATAY